MKAYKNNVREVIETVNTSTKETTTVRVIYWSGQQKAFLPDKVPDRIAAFMKWSRNIKEYPVSNTNRTTKHYY